MMESKTSVSFPVMFFDGECEMDIGNIGIHPYLEFKKLQSILSQKIGISPHQITLAIICRKKSRPSGTRKIPINEKVNFSTILQQEKDCYFLVSLKPTSRKGGGGRRSGAGRVHFEEAESLTSPHHGRFSIDPPQKVLLRRDSNAQPLQFGEFGHPSSLPVSYPNQGLRLGFGDYGNQLLIQKERYLMTINSFENTPIDDNFGYGRGINAAAAGDRAVCEVCSKANGGAIPFHWCVYDPTTVVFRSPAGPIARPSKG